MLRPSYFLASILSTLGIVVEEVVMEEGTEALLWRRVSRPEDPGRRQRTQVELRGRCSIAMPSYVRGRLGFLQG
jgi:hypothetical protein